MADPPFTTGDFHTVAQKQLLNALYETLTRDKLDWKLIAPMVETARQLARSEFQHGARVRFHTLKAEGDDWVESEEAFLGIAVADPESGEDWLTETFWVSDIALAAGDAGEAEKIIAALERSIKRIREKLPAPSKGTD
ncbi:MAG: hypothetical protein ACT4OE_11185 [Sphingosinicella sp.]